MTPMEQRKCQTDNEKVLDELLKASRILADETYQVPPQIMWVDNSTIATLGNFSASIGKAKSKKTFNVTAIAASALKNGAVLKYRSSFPEDKRTVLYIDTEQGRHHCQKVLKRILRLAGLPRGRQPLGSIQDLPV